MDWGDSKLKVDVLEVQRQGEQRFRHWIYKLFIFLFHK